MQTMLLSLALTPILDVLADLASWRLLKVEASKTLWGTLVTRMLAWVIAWRLTRPAAVPTGAQRR